MKKSRLMYAIILCLAGAVQSCAEIEVLQEDSAEISVTNGFQVVTSSSTSAAFEVKSNSEWKVVCNADWISDYTKEGSGDGVVTVSFSENTDSEKERSATFAIMAGKKSRSVTLVQTRHGYDDTDAQLELSTEAETIVAEEVSYSLNVESNTIWGVYTEADWINSYTKMGEGDGEIVLGFDSYKNRKEDRYATFYVTARDVTKVFKLTQTKTDQILVEDITVEKFIAKAADPEMFYRLLGTVGQIEGAGTLTLTDYSGSVRIPGMLAAEGGEIADFQALGITEGDVVSVTGVRADEAGTAILGNSYLEVHHPVKRMSSLSEFQSEPDNTENWYRIEGIISDITDNMNGNFTLSEINSSATFSVEGVLSGINGPKGQFANLGAKADDIIMLLAPGKTGNVITDAAYLGHKPSKMPLGVLADWTFDAETMEKVGSPATWGNNLPLDNSSKFEVPVSVIGETPYYVWDDAMKSRMTYYQADRTAIGTGVKLNMYNTGQPGFTEMWLEDAFIFDIDAGVAEVPAGTKLRFAFNLRIASGHLACYMLEWYDGENWVIAEDSAHPVETLGSYSFNIRRTKGNDDSLIEFTFTITKAVPELRLRIRAAAPYDCNGVEMTAPNGASRMRGVVKGEDVSPYLEVVE